MQTEWKCCLSLNSPLIFTDFQFVKYNNTNKIFITSQAYVRSIIKHHWILNSLLSYIPWFIFRFSSLELCCNRFSCSYDFQRKIIFSLAVTYLRKAGHAWRKMQNFQAAQSALPSHACVFRGSRFSSLPANACSTESNIPFPLFYLCGT